MVNDSRVSQYDRVLLKGTVWAGLMNFVISRRIAADYESRPCLSGSLFSFYRCELERSCYDMLCLSARLKIEQTKMFLITRAASVH